MRSSRVLTTRTRCQLRKRSILEYYSSSTSNYLQIFGGAHTVLYLSRSWKIVYLSRGYASTEQVKYNSWTFGAEGEVIVGLQHAISNHSVELACGLRRRTTRSEYY
jgi:hypothetical protein